MNALALSLLILTGLTPLCAMAWLTARGPAMAPGVRRIPARRRACLFGERVVVALLWLASLVSVLTTVGIVASIFFEAMRFLEQVGVVSFLTGTTWSPGGAFLESVGRAGDGASAASFGSVPVFAGTFVITAIAMAVAMPVGLMSAVYLSEYAPGDVRRWAKPMLEILAGIPTVVYGFFAALTVSPIVVALAQAFGLEASANNALAPGIVMGIMIIPLVSSLSDDVITAVPRSLRDGALALGTTHAETILHVVLPAAMPGIVSAFLLAVSRALGETMIVVMAAGMRANLTLNPLEDMTTVTVRIVAAMTGDKAFDSLETLSAFALGLVLFVVTLVLNVVATLVIRRFRRRYE